MIRPTLPHRPDREDLLGFWMVISLLTGLLLSTLLLLMGGAPDWTGVVAGALTVLALLLLGLQSERRIERMYARWNRLARGYSRRARRWVTWVVYRTVVTAAARTGASGLPVGASKWMERGTLSPSGYASQAGDPVDGGEGRPEELQAWLVRTHRGWAVALLPFLGVLRALDVRKERSVASDNYTLY